jgi:pimeloyl-ACP methyl ester carboxylesterase
MGCGGSTVVSPKATEIKLECSDGIRLAAQSWRVNVKGAYTPIAKTVNGNGTFMQRVHPEELRVLCLHGWMDNCRSFYRLAPALIEQLDSAMVNDVNTGQHYSTARYQRVHVVALDLPGHGLSSHKSEDAPPMVRAEYLFYIAEAIRQLQWWKPHREIDTRSSSTTTMMTNTLGQDKFVLIGHSMSAGISLMYAAAFPEQIRNLVLLDSLGNLSRGISTTSYNLRQFVQARQLDGPLLADPLNQYYYPSVEAALQVRVKSARSFPGNQSISQEAAKELVQRGLLEEDKSKGVKHKFRFRHDPRLMWNSLLYLTEEQLDAIYQDIQCGALVLLGRKGWPVEEQQKRRVQEQLRSAVVKTLPGSHHLHMDPDSSEAVVQEIVAFLEPPI